MMPSCLPSHTTTLEHIYICITAVVTILRIYGFTPLPPPPLGWVRDADPRIKLPPVKGLVRKRGGARARAAGAESGAGISNQPPRQGPEPPR